MFRGASDTTVVTVFHATGNLKQIRLYIITQATNNLPQYSVDVHNVLGADL